MSLTELPQPRFALRVVDGPELVDRRARTGSSRPGRAARSPSRTRCRSERPGTAGMDRSGTRRRSCRSAARRGERPSAPACASRTRCSPVTRFRRRTSCLPVLEARARLNSSQSPEIVPQHSQRVVLMPDGSGLWRLVERSKSLRSERRGREPRITWYTSVVPSIPPAYAFLLTRKALPPVRCA